MLKNTVVIAALLIFSIITYYLYQYYKIPAGVEPQSGNDELIAWLSLGASIISLITAIIGLVEKVIDKKKSP